MNSLVYRGSNDDDSERLFSWRPEPEICLLCLEEIKEGKECNCKSEN